MALDIDIPYSTKEGINYLIKFTQFHNDKLPEGISIPVIDIVIETDADLKDINNSAFSLLQLTTIRNLKNRNSLLIFENHYKFNLIWDCFVGTKITISQLFGKL